MKKTITALAVLAGVLAFTGAEGADGSLSWLWFFGWLLVCCIFGVVANALPEGRRARK